MQKVIYKIISSKRESKTAYTAYSAKKMNISLNQGSTDNRRTEITLPWDFVITI